MDLTQMAEQISSQTMMLASGQAQEDLMTDFRLWTEGEDQVIGFVIQGSKMTIIWISYSAVSGMGSALSF